jgi:PmbA protein
LPGLENIYDRFRSHHKLIIADDYELVVQKVVKQFRKFRNGEILQERQEEKHWIGLRVLHRKQPGKSATNSSSDENLHWLVDSAFAAAEQSGVDPYFRFPLWKTNRSAKVDTQPPGLLEVPASLFPELALQPALFDETYETIDVETKLYRKTEKDQPSYRKIRSLGTFGLFYKAPERNFWLRDTKAFEKGFDEAVDTVERILGLGLALQKSVRLKAPTVKSVVLGAPVMAVLLREISGWFSASNVQRGTSPLTRPASSRDKRKFSAGITLIDDATLPYGLNTTPFDMEGTPSQKTVLIEKGVFQNLLYDSYQAAQENRLSTGNLIRPLNAHFPEVGITNLFLAPSPKKVVTLVSDMGQGVYLETLDEIDIPSNQPFLRRLTGSGWRVEHGTCVQPVHSVDFTIDLRQLLDHAGETANDLTFFGEIGSPSIFFPEIPISK